MSRCTNAFLVLLTKTALAVLFLLGLPAAASDNLGNKNHQPSISLIQTSQTVVRLTVDPLDSPNKDSFGARLAACLCTTVPGVFVLAFAVGMVLALRYGIDETEKGTEKGDVLLGHKKEEPWLEMAMGIVEKETIESRQRDPGEPCVLETTATAPFTCPFAIGEDDGLEIAADREYELAMESHYDQLWDALQAYDSN